ncbi:DNA primase [Pseudodesulfovibrio pelocollis]|uniref:DNA primase n=1 Tax=Pseudodesulfovibrio pelocollis TaxID=3051432 RepID=UPI00255A9C1D|nr:DNA primase [Pseudodesulfovibrio sp. SB368]
MLNNIMEIKSKLSLEKIAHRYNLDLKPSSGSMKGACPFHQETKPSFHIFPEGRYYCFGCQAAGDVFDFVSSMEGWDFVTTLKWLAEQAGVQLTQAPSVSPTNALQRTVDLAQSFYSQSLELHAHGKAGDYARKRGLTREIIERFGIGYASDEWQNLAAFLRDEGCSVDDALQVGVVGQAESGRIYDRFRDRLIFPIHTLTGKIAGFGGRDITDTQDAKYLNSPDSPLFKKSRMLYGLFQARKSVQKMKAINLIEGYLDVLSLVSHGYENSVGYLGTAFTEAHADLISRLASYAYVIPDADNAGRKAAIQICTLLLQRGLECWVVDLPEGEDVDSLLNKRGGEAVFDRALRGATHGFSYITPWVDAMNIKDKSRWVSDFLNTAEQQFHGWLIPRLSIMLEISEFELRRMIRDAPEMYLEEQKVLQFLSSFPAYVASMQARGVEELFQTPCAKKQWDALLAGESIDQEKLELAGVDVVNYWQNEIQVMLPEEIGV